MANKNVTQKREKWLSSIVDDFIKVKDISFPPDIIEGNISLNDNFSRDNENLINVYMTAPIATWGKRSLDANTIHKAFLSIEEIVNYANNKISEGNIFALYSILTLTILDPFSFTPDQTQQFAKSMMEDAVALQASSFYKNLPRKTSYVLKACFTT